MALIKKKVTSSGGSSNRLENQACDSGVAVKDVVYLDEDGVAQKADASTYETAHAIGIVESKPSSTLANIVLPGGVTSSIFTGLDELEEYFLSDSTPGGIVTAANIPTDPNTVVFPVGRPVSQTKFLVDFGLKVVRS